MRLAWLTLLPLLTACNSTPSTMHEGTVSRITDQAAQDAAPLPPAADPEAGATHGDTLRVVRSYPHFSHPSGNAPYDVMQLVFRGSSWLEGSGELTVTDPDGKVIFRETLTVPDLEASRVQAPAAPPATRAEREAFVRQRIDQFLLPAQFVWPVIDPKATFSTTSTTLDRATWNNVQQQSHAIRFEYLKGLNGRRAIAWSPLRQKIVRLL